MNHKALIKAAILTMSLVQLGTNAIAPILASISKAFPDSSDTTIQFLMTFPILFTMIVELISAFLAGKIPRKILAIAGLATVGAGGILAFLFHSSLPVMFVWAAVIGIGLGLVAPMAPALINELFDGQERQTMLGWQNSASTIGSMIMTFAGGLLAFLGWHYGYLVYLICIPGIVCTLIGLKGSARSGRAGGTKSEHTRTKFRLVIWREMIIAAFFLMLYSAIPANIAMLVAQRGVGDSATSGIMSTLFALAGMITGLVFGLLTRILRSLTNTVGVLMLCAGSLLMGIGTNVAVLIIGCMLAGISMSMVMPVCMGAASRLPGYETINSAIIMASTSVGIFIAPLLTSLTEAVTGSSAVSYRFIAIGIMSILLAVLTRVLRDKKETT